MSKKKKQRVKQKRLEKQAQQRTQKTSKINFRYTYPILLLLAVIGAFLLRVLPSWSKVFIGGSVHFREVDPYYQMRLVDYMVHNFPNFLRFDYYTLYLTSDQYEVWTQGAPIGFGPIFTFLIAFPAWVLGLGHPSPHLVETIGAFVPPILASLVCLVVYFLAKALTDSRRVGILSAIIVSVLPGEYLFRSLLGFTDHHILEVLLTSLVLLFVVVGIKRKKLWWALPAGITFGVYQVAWHGGMFFIFILWIWFVVQYFYDLKKAPNTFLCKFALILFTLSCLPLLYFYRGGDPALFNFKVIVTTAAVGTPIFLYLISRFSKKIILLASGALASVALVIGFLLFKDYIVVHAVNQLRSVFWGFGSSISEAQPTNLPAMFEYFGIPFILTFVGFILLLKKQPNMLLLVWTIVLFLALIGQRRWCYYFVVPVSVMSAICIERVSDLVKPQAKYAVLVILICFTLFPSANSIWGLSRIDNQMTLPWYNSLVWLRENSQDPFGDVDEFTAKVQTVKPDYGVLAWWDFGHWITYVSHRAPISNPAYQDTAAGSRFFASRTVEEAEAELEGYNIKYIILSWDVITGKWYAVMAKSGKPTPAEESVAGMIWQGQYPYYKLVHDEGSVRIYERTD